MTKPYFHMSDDIKDESENNAIDISFQFGFFKRPPSSDSPTPSDKRAEGKAQLTKAEQQPSAMPAETKSQETDQPNLEDYNLPEPGPEPWLTDATYSPEESGETGGNSPDAKLNTGEVDFSPPVYSKPPVNSVMPELPDEKWFAKNLGISKAQFQELVAFRADYDKRNRYKLLMMGVLFMPVTLLGAVLGYVRGHNRFEREKDIMPDLYPLSQVKRVSMSLGIVVAWVLTLLIVGVLFVMLSQHSYAVYRWQMVFTLFALNAFISLIIYSGFSLWRHRVRREVVEGRKFGSARFALKDELYTLKNTTGYYIGQGHLFNDRGHLLTVAGTRGGKGTNLIIPNLLDAGNMETSWVVIDPKGENAAITADYQRSKGQNVVIVNPWGLLEKEVGEAQSFNPLDMLPPPSDPNLVDDVQMIAEMIVPVKPDDHNSFFTDSARIIISGILLHLVTTQTGDKKTLNTLWEWLRLEAIPDAETDPWNELLAEMQLNDTPVNGIVVQNARREILKMSASGDETFGSIMSDVLLSTDFIKSPPLQKALQSGFDPAVLAEGKTTVYVIIPADKLRSHSRWLRLVTTSLMRSVIRKPKNRVTFLLDEFAALGYLPEIETALSTYAGYNLTVWPILQTLGQLSHLYKDNWQTFIGNCAVRQYFSINDNESAEYVSRAIGDTSNVIRLGVGKQQKTDANARRLVTPDEVRRGSGERMFIFIGNLPPTIVAKIPYYKVTEWRDRAQINPYL